MSAEKIKEILKKYEKEFGKETAFVADEIKSTKEEIVPTGILSLDMALGIGGLPKGKIYELYGQESSGKTTLSLIILSQFQKQDVVCAFIDAENSFDQDWAKALGVDTSSLLVLNVDSLEDAFTKLEFSLQNGVGFIVFDSVAAPPTVSQTNADFTDSTVGVRARVMSIALSKLLPTIRKNKASLLFINQVREKIGVYGNPETTPGGRALKFFSSIRMATSKKPIKSYEDVIGDEIIIKVDKNKFAPPMKKAKFLLYYDGRYMIDYIEILSRLELISKSGAWIRELITEEKKQFHGSQALLDEISNNKEFREIVDKAIYSKISLLSETSEEVDEE